MSNVFKYSKSEGIGKGKEISVDFRKVNINYPFHTHEYFELEFIHSGTGVHYINTTSYPIKRGSLLFLTPADCHGLRFFGDAKVWNISFVSSMISDNMLKRICAMTTYKNYFEEKEFLKLEACAELLKNEIETTGHVQPLLEYFLSLVLFENKQDKETPLSKVLDYVKLHFRENPTIEEASKIACFSPVYFGNVFKKTYGINFNTYVNRKKVECAKILLANGMSVTDACFESGFNSLSNFLKVFKTEAGFAPKEYQKKNKVFLKEIYDFK